MASPADGRHHLLTAAVVAPAAVLLLVACSGSDNKTEPRAAAESAQATATVTATTTVPQPPAGSAAAATPARQAVTDPQAELDVKDQVGQGRLIRVEDVQISNGTGYVAVFASNGTVLGSAKVTPTVRRLTVTLDKPVLRTSQLLAILYADDGDQRFEPGADARVVDEDGDFYDETFDYFRR